MGDENHHSVKVCLVILYSTMFLQELCETCSVNGEILQINRPIKTLRKW